MAKKLNVVLIIVTALICLFIVVFVAIPHHYVTKSKAVDLAYNYFNERMDNTIQVISAEIEDYNGNIVKDIFDYWNMDIGHYSVNIQTDNSTFCICVDAFSGYVYDGSEGINWIK